jgi:hypothetical protein
VKTLGVVLDSELSMHEHISKIVKTCFFHMRSLFKARPYLTQKAACHVAVSLILSKLDYCNSIFANLPVQEKYLLRFISSHSFILFLFQIIPQCNIESLLTC